LFLTRDCDQYVFDFNDFGVVWKRVWSALKW